MRVSKILESIAKTKPAQKVYGWCAEQGHDKILNHTLPQVETVLSTACYVWSTERQNKIPREQKNLLQVQNVGSGLVGLVVASTANRWVGKKGEEIIKHLDPEKLDPKVIRKCSTGIRVGLPILTTAIVMRYAIPVALAVFSGKFMDKVRAGKDKLTVKDDNRTQTIKPLNIVG